jgi:tRNA (cmo5U34)-methyltransferase
MINGELRVGSEIVLMNKKWSFSPAIVADKFENHICQSVPLYAQGHQLILKLSDYFIHHNNKDLLCYDLGSSTGILTELLAKQHKNIKNISWLGIDTEQSMIDKAVDKYGTKENLNFICADVLNHTLQSGTPFVVCYYLLQFLSPENKELLLKKIYDSLCCGGGVIVFEKVFAKDAFSQDIFHMLHANFKKEQGLSSEEIYDKSESLKGVMHLSTSSDNHKLISHIGFKACHTVMKYLNFEGYLLVK